MLPFSAFTITRDQHLQSSEHLQLLLFIKMWYHWYNTKPSDPFYLREHYCIPGPTSQLCSSTTYWQHKILSNVTSFCHSAWADLCQISIPAGTATEKKYRITHCTQLIFCYHADPLKPGKLLQFTWLRIQHIPFRSQHSLSEQGKGAATACEPHAHVSCTATEPQTLPLLHNFCLFLWYCCLGLWKELF